MIFQIVTHADAIQKVARTVLATSSLEIVTVLTMSLGKIVTNVNTVFMACFLIVKNVTVMASVQ